MVYLLKMVIFHGYVSHNQMFSDVFWMILLVDATMGPWDHESVGLPEFKNQPQKYPFLADIAL
jgi:hypothetical protein